MNKRYFLGGIALFFIVIISTIFFLSEKKDLFEVATVERGNLIQEVGVTGRIEPSKQVDLSFEISGKVESINSKVGDLVKSGYIIISLSNSEASAELEEAKAKLKTEGLRLSEVLFGSRIEDIKIKESELDKANQDLLNLYNDIKSIIDVAITNVDDALDKQVGIMFDNDNSNSPQLNFLTSDQVSEYDSEFKRVEAGEARDSMKKISDDLKNRIIGDKEDLNKTNIQINIVKVFLDRLNNALNSAINLSSSNEVTYKGNLNTARTNINTSISEIKDKIQSITSQEIVIKKAENELELKRAGSSAEAIAVQEAIVEQADASVRKQEIKLAKTVLRAPFSGLITRQDLNVGEIVQTQTVVVSMISENSYQIKANIPEADITSVSLSNSARVTLDALEADREFIANVISIDPAETQVEGVSTYKVILKFEEDYDFLKSGMTANIDIKTSVLENVLYIPTRSVISKDGNKYVRIPSSGGEYKEVIVTTGIRDSFGNIEILSGLKEGDKVITFIPE